MAANLRQGQLCRYGCWLYRKDLAMAGQSSFHSESDDLPAVGAILASLARQG